MSGICGIEVINLKCEMDLIIAKVIRAIHIPEPGELKKMRCDAVSQVYELETAIIGILCARYSKVERLFVKCKRFVQVVDVQIVVGECKIHMFVSLLIKI